MKARDATIGIPGVYLLDSTLKKTMLHLASGFTEIKEASVGIIVFPS